MSSLGNLHISLLLETAQFQQGLNKSTHQSHKFAKQFEVNLSAAQHKARQFSERTTQYLNNIERAAIAINKTTSRTFLYSGINWISSQLSTATSQTLKYADSFTELQNRMRLVTDSQNAMAAATEAVFDISLRTNQAVSATAEVYQRFAKNAEALNISQAQVAELTETVSQTVAMSGASAASSEAALMQFGQALAAGELRGAELNSVMEQTPALAQAIADGLGVSVGSLKEMGKNGELSINKVIDALQKVKNQVNTDFENRVKTLSMSFTNLETSMIKFVGDVDATYGVTNKLANGIEFLADNLDEVVSAAGLFISALSIGHMSKYTIELLKTGIASGKNALAHQQEAKEIYAKVTALRVAAQAEMATLNAQYQLAQSEKTRMALREQMKIQSQQIIALAHEEANAKRNLATANKLAATAAKGLQGAMALIGGPIGAASIAGGALWYFSQQASEARRWALDTANANQLLAQSYTDLSEAALSIKITEQLDNIKKYNEEIKKVQAGIATREIGTNFDGINIAGGIGDAELAKLQNEMQLIAENADIAKQAIEKMLQPLAEKMLQGGKTLEDVRNKFRLLGVDANTAEVIIAKLPASFEKSALGAENATTATLDFDKALKSLKERSQTMQQKLEVLTLKSQGHAKASFILAGLYETLGVSGAEYSKVLNAIANGDVAAAQSAASAINLSAQQLQTMLDMGKQLDGLFSVEEKTQTIEANIKTHSKGGSGENARENWLSFYDDLRKKSGSTLSEIDLEQARMFERLEEHNRKGVVSHQEYEVAKLAITQRFAKERLELAGKYAPEKLLAHNLKEEIAAIQALHQAGELTKREAEIATQQRQFDYAQQQAQHAVGPLDQMRAIYDPEQESLNQQAREMAQLQSFYDQKLMAEEEFQQRKKELIANFENERFQREMNQYSAGLNNLGSAFGSLASMVEQSAGKQSSAYKAMFAISKGFAVAEASVKLSQAIMQAMASPEAMTPAQKFANMAAIASAGVGVLSQLSSIGFSSGGYTGNGGKYTPAGIVHRGEYVLTKEATARLGLGYLDYLNYGTKRGFANGGGVGVPSVPSAHYGTLGGGEMHNEIAITINIDANGNEDVSVENKAEQGKQLSEAITAKVLDVLKQQRRPGGLLA